MASDFAVEAVPTLILLAPDGKIISRQTGFIEATELAAWLEAGRARAAAGLWEGTAPGTQFDEFLKKAAADNLGPKEIQKLVELLGDADPANPIRPEKFCSPSVKMPCHRSLRRSATLISASGLPRANCYNGWHRT